MQFDFTEIQRKITRKVLTIFQIQTQQLSKNISNSYDHIIHRNNEKPSIYRKQRQKILNMQDLSVQNPFNGVHINDRINIIRNSTKNIISKQNIGGVEQEHYDRSYTFGWKGVEIINLLFIKRKAYFFNIIKQADKLPSSLSFKNTAAFINSASIRQASNTQIKLQKGSLKTKINRNQNWIDEFLKDYQEKNKPIINANKKQHHCHKVDLTNKLIPILQPQLFSKYAQALIR